MDQYVGEMDLRDGNRAHFRVTIAAADGIAKAVTECGFEKQPTKESIEEFEEAMRVMLEDWFGPLASSEHVDAAAGNPEVMRQEREAFLRGGSSN
jgi:hypothetical protein